MSEPEVSIVVPTLNEGPNLRALSARIAGALPNIAYEILIVDDNSQDDTVQICQELAETHPLRLQRRERPANGLGGAVLHGLEAARGNVLVVMDADLQHPPERLPALIEPIRTGAAEFTLGSRYVPGATTAQRWSVFRRFNSWVATLLAKPFSGGANDPMSGFFALSRARFQQAERLMPLGYKIGLELMCKCRISRVTEIPIHFADRAAGESKLSLREQFRYLEHLSRLYDFCYPRLSPISKFLIVLLLGGAMSLGVFLLSLEWLGARLNPALNGPIAYLAHIAVTAVFHRRYIKAQREFILTEHPWREFVLLSLAEWLSCAAAAIYIGSRFASPISAWEWFAIPFAAGTVARYVLRKELMHDLRGLRREHRREELGR